MSWINLPTPSFENFRKMKPTQVLILLIAFVIFILIAMKQIIPLYWLSSGSLYLYSVVTL